MSMEIGVGTTVGPYLVQRELGRGGMAVVWLAHHTATGEAVALKQLMLAAPSARQRFLREAEVQTRVDHPNVVAVRALLEHGGSVVLVLEYVAGPTLAQTLASEHLSLGEVDRIFRQVSAGVQAIHEAGLVHRDLKPGNVLLVEQDGEVVARVADFGLAKLLHEEGEALTRTGVAMGTPAYMAPEQMRSARRADVRADVYALGVMLYEMLSGRVPHAGSEMVEVYSSASSGSYVALEQLVLDLPAHLGPAVDGALHPDPSRRWQDVPALLDAWRGVAEASNPALTFDAGSLPSLPETQLAAPRRWPVRLMLGLVGGVLGFAASVGLLWAVGGSDGILQAGPIVLLLVLVGGLTGAAIGAVAVDRDNRPPWLAVWVGLGVLPLSTGFLGTALGVAMALDAVEGQVPDIVSRLAPMAIRVALWTSLHGAVLAAGWLTCLAWVFSWSGRQVPVRNGWVSLVLVGLAGGGLVSTGAAADALVLAVAMLAVGAVVRLGHSRAGAGWVRVLVALLAVLAVLSASVAAQVHLVMADFEHHFEQDLSGPLATAAAFEGLSSGPLDLDWRWALVVLLATGLAAFDPFLLRLPVRSMMRQGALLIGVAGFVGAQWMWAHHQVGAIGARVVPELVRTASLEQLGVSLTDARLNAQEQQAGLGHDAPERFQERWRGAVLVESAGGSLQLGDQIVTVGGRPLAGAVDLLTVLADCDCAREGVAVGVLRAQTDADAVLTELRLYPNPSSADPPATPRP